MVGRTKWRICILLVITLININLVVASQEVMKNLSKGFSSVLNECQKELNIQDHIMQDFYNFWREEYELVNKELGCAIICIASKHDLISDESTMHHGKAEDFAKKHGADDATAKQLVSMIHECEKSRAGESDDCVRVLEIAKCFRTQIHELNWAPTMEMILEEVITEVQD